MKRSNNNPKTTYLLGLIILVLVVIGVAYFARQALYCPAGLNSNGAAGSLCVDVDAQQFDESPDVGI